MSAVLELQKGSVNFDPTHHSFTLVCPTSSLPENTTNVHQHFYLKRKERDALKEYYPTNTQETFYETYYDNKDFTNINNNTWIKSVFHNDGGKSATFYSKQMELMNSDYVQYIEKIIKEEDLGEGVEPFVTFKVVREVKDFDCYSVHSDTITIYGNPRFTEPELYDENVTELWEYTVFTICAQTSIINKDSQTFKPLARSKIVKYLDQFEIDLYCDLQNRNIIKNDEEYADYEGTLADYCNVDEIIDYYKEKSKRKDYKDNKK
ncbi:predicted protein [Naegleria gruberi]|uniref:Predicted protein n=1 Tax=Naegleria gruberi TaxID=5762 RepID=D2VBT1_NAEGR|nr:uncharacterized protein NAEGRDRAFT_66323 [Naegleria gruberi]EFC45642.1 predicted protein [Naegleria gruberi]|eukprot:XP_002678386.1 predicted protein [Naegleria gruberi strain NEG-M]